MFGMGKTRTEYGVRFGGKDTWGHDTRSKAESACKRMNKSVKGGGTRAKVIQRTVKLTAIKGRVKDTCSGGKCRKSGQVCTKHGKKFGRDADSLYTADGRNRNNVRWDEEGHRWS
jgi:hypothetical protein